MLEIPLVVLFNCQKELFPYSESRFIHLYINIKSFAEYFMFCFAINKRSASEMNYERDGKSPLFLGCHYSGRLVLPKKLKRNFILYSSNKNAVREHNERDSLSVGVVRFSAFAHGPRRVVVARSRKSRIILSHPPPPALRALPYYSRADSIWPGIRAELLNGACVYLCEGTVLKRGNSRINSFSVLELRDEAERSGGTSLRFKVIGALLYAEGVVTAFYWIFPAIVPG